MVGSKPENALRKRLTSLPAECYSILTFGELEIGDRYIGLPLPGDNSRHGGYRGAHWLYRKIGESSEPSYENIPKDNAVRLIDGVTVFNPSSMAVIKVE